MIKGVKINAVPPCFAGLHLPQARFNGRTRVCLPIGTPAPGPSSTVFAVPISTKQGSLTGQVLPTLPITAFIQYTAHYSYKTVGLSTSNFSLWGCPHGQCVLGAEVFATAQTRSVSFLLCKFQFVELALEMQNEKCKMQNCCISSGND